MAVAENGGGAYRISLWDLRTRVKRFSAPIKDPAIFLSWSASGSFLIAATSVSGIVFLDPVSGAFLDRAPGITDRVVFALTGKSERSMVTYSPSGRLSYWDFDTNEEIRRYPVSKGLSSVLLFGSRRFFSGIGSDGLSVYDAVSGSLIARDKSVTKGALAAADPESAGFYCLQGDSVIQYYLTSQGRLERLKHVALPGISGGVSSFAPLPDGRIILGAFSGGLFRLDRDGSKTSFQTEERTRITVVAVSGPFIAFLAEGSIGKGAGIIPLDYRDLGGALLLQPNAHEDTQITPAGFPAASGTGRFILWQSGSSWRGPSVWIGGFTPRGPELARTGALDGIFSQTNFRAVSAREDAALFLTERGALTAVSLPLGEAALSSRAALLWTRQAAGTRDAAFLDSGNVILARDAACGPPFALLSESGLAPLQWPQELSGSGLRLYPLPGGLYGTVLSRTRSGPVTRLARIGEEGGARQFLAEYNGEEGELSVAALAGDGFSAAARPGEEGAALLPDGAPLQCGAGFAVSVSGGLSAFIVLDTEGVIAWADPVTGRIQAQFTLYEDRWILSRRGAALREGAVLGPEEGGADGVLLPPR
jgi:hypothetical protein